MNRLPIRCTLTPSPSPYKNWFIQKPTQSWKILIKRKQDYFPCRFDLNSYPYSLAGRSWRWAWPTPKVANAARRMHSHSPVAKLIARITPLCAFVPLSIGAIFLRNPAISPPHNEDVILDIGSFRRTESRLTIEKEFPRVIKWVWHWREVGIWYRRNFSWVLPVRYLMSCRANGPVHKLEACPVLVYSTTHWQFQDEECRTRWNPVTGSK